VTTPTTVKVQLKLRQDTSSGWSAVNPILLAGELGRESNTGKIKIGDGSTAWNSLAYQPFGALITNADISATAEIAVSKLADGAARQLLQTDTAGTGVEWTSNVDVPGTLDVTGAATFDAAVTIDGNSTAASFIPTGSTVPTNGVYLSAANNVSIATNSTERLRIDAAGQIEAVSLGSAAAPTFSWTGDPNTGIYSPGADQVAISTNGTGRLFVDSNGKVGIGTATAADDAVLTVTKGTNIAYPGQNNAQLHINNSTGAAGVLIASSTLSNIFFADAAANNIGRIYYDHSSDFLAVHTNSSERMRLDSSGRLGLGSSAPSERFDLQLANGAGNLGIRLVHIGQVEYKIGINDSDDKLYITNNNGDAAIGSTTKGLVITPTGLVGIGTTSVPAPFSVSRSGNEGLEVTPLTGNQVEIQGYNRATSNYVAALNKFSQHIWNLNATSEAARIDSSGRLLVGTSSGVSAAFVNSSIQAHGITGDASSVTLYRFTTSATAAATPRLVMARSGSDSKDFTVVANGNRLGQFNFVGADGTQFISAASIDCEVDGTPGTNDMPGRLVLSVTLDGASSPTEALRITNDRVVAYNQPAPAAVNATATLTVANLKTGIITSTSAAATDMTLPTGTDTQAGFSGTYDNFTFEWSVINTGPSLVRVLAGTAHTIVGSGSVATGTSGRFASRRTAANTFVTYRLS